jgi:hypothetical protein
MRIGLAKNSYNNGRTSGNRRFCFSKVLEWRIKWRLVGHICDKPRETSKEFLFLTSATSCPWMMGLCLELFSLEQDNK